MMKVSHMSIACVLLGACGPIPTMIMPDKLESAGEVYEVSGAAGWFLPSLFTQHIRFGPYESNVHTSDDSGVSTGATLLNGGKETRVERRRAWFTMHGSDQGDWKGTCIRDDRTVIQHETSIEIGNHGIHSKDHPELTEDEHSLRCDLKSPGGLYAKVEFYLVGDEPSGGVARFRPGDLIIAPAFEQRDQPWKLHETAGFVIQAEQFAKIAALDTGGHKRVAFRRDLDAAERDFAAAVCVTILLQRFLD